VSRRQEACSPDQAERIIFVTGGAFTAKARAFLDGVANLSLDSRSTCPP
jgi:hypothetical protein